MDAAAIRSAVRDQARLLGAGAPPPAPADPQQHVWTAQQWWEAFQFLFITREPPEAEAHHQDDLLFFVKSESHPARAPPFFVRRKARALPAELCLSGRDFGAVDWPRSVLLNLVLQCQYQLTVVACGRDALPLVAEGAACGPGSVTVAKPVYASAAVTAVNLDSSRGDAADPVPCYPDVCFAVDNFDDAFGELVLDDADRCYCVVLQALLDQPHGGGAPAQAAAAAQRAAPQAAAAAARTLFAGYVSYGQICDFVGAGGRGRGLLGGLLGRARGADKVVMTGPGGVGRCEVAVTPREAPAGGGGGGGAGGEAGGAAQLEPARSTPPKGLLQRARLLASGVQQALSDAGGGGAGGGGGGGSMMCALMLMRLPASFVARELLDGWAA
ncbi:hypothetical protein HT031_001226 [Scenedesmus sp. PABB004]|nr:hypothetical protein HT031_001226 [Scenedesmus sp. PABB004]